MSQKAWLVADIRAAEDALIARLGKGTLMYRAADGLATHCLRLLSERFGGGYGRRVLLLVGTGNNGGDTLYAGAWLARRGIAVAAWLADPSHAYADGLAAFYVAGGSTVDTTPGIVDLVLDGIAGIGGRGGLRPEATRVLAQVMAARASDGKRPTVVAVDVPSGVDADTGMVTGEAVTADVTVTFGCLKRGLLTGAGAEHAGRVELVDIGLAPTADPAAQVATDDDIRAWWPRPNQDSDKYARGVVGLATGSATYPGAAVLSVGGASAGPVGMIRYAGGAADLVRQRYPSVIVTDRAADAGRVQAWVCGSGLGTDERAAAELRALLPAQVPICLDADALTLISGGVWDWLGGGRALPVITPHDREYERLVGQPPGPDRIAAALDAAIKIYGIALLKGDRTVIASVLGEVWVNPTGTPVLATAGSGDVLSGLLGSLLAAGLPQAKAAAAAAYVHGLAGQEAARGGPVTSADIAAALRPTLARLLADAA